MFRESTWIVIQRVITLVTFQPITDWRVTTVSCYRFGNFGHTKKANNKMNPLRSGHFKVYQVFLAQILGCPNLYLKNWVEFTAQIYTISQQNKIMCYLFFNNCIRGRNCDDDAISSLGLILSNKLTCHLHHVKEHFQPFFLF